MKKTLLPIALFILLLFLARPVLAETLSLSTCALNDIWKGAIDTFIQTLTNQPPPTLEEIQYDEALTQRITNPPQLGASIPSPSFCTVNIEEEINTFREKGSAQQDLPKLTIQNPSIHHNPTYTHLKKGTIHPPQNKEISYDLTLSRQDLKPLNYAVFDQFSQFTVSENTQVKKKEDVLSIHTQEIDLGNGKITLLEKPETTKSSAFVFGPTFAAYPRQMHPAEPIYAYSFGPGTWNYPESISPALRLEQQETYPHSLVLMTLESNLLNTPVSFTLSTRQEGRTENALDPIEIYPQETAFPTSTSDSVVQLRENSLHVMAGKLSLDPFQSHYSLQIEGDFTLFVTDQGVHLTLGNGNLNLQRKDSRND